MHSFPWLLVNRECRSQHNQQLQDLSVNKYRQQKSSSAAACTGYNSHQFSEYAHRICLMSCQTMDSLQSRGTAEVSKFTKYIYLLAL